MNELHYPIDALLGSTSMTSLKDKPPSEEADGVVGMMNGESEQGNEDKDIPVSDSIEELKKLTDLLSIRMAENGKKSSKKPKSIFSFKEALPPMPLRMQRRLRRRHQNAQPQVPLTCWQKFLEIWSWTKWVRRVRRRIRRRRRRLLLQILQNAQNPPPPRRRRRDRLPLLIRVRRGLLNFFGLGRPVRVAPANDGNAIGNNLVFGNAGMDGQQQNVVQNFGMHNSTLRRRTQLIELFGDDDPLPAQLSTNANVSTTPVVVEG